MEMNLFVALALMFLAGIFLGLAFSSLVRKAVTSNLIWNGKEFVVIIDGQRIATSPDGICWTERALPWTTP